MDIVIDSITALTATIGCVVSFMTFAVAYLGYRVGIGQYERSVHIDVFRKYADKYNAIVKPDIYNQWKRALSGDREQWDELTPTMIEYLNLIWEESYMKRTERIPQDLWDAWLPEIEDVFKSEFARETIKKYGFHFTQDLSRLLTEDTAGFPLDTAKHALPNSVAITPGSTPQVATSVAMRQSAPSP